MNEESEKEIRVGFYYSDGVLYRKWRPEGSTEGDVSVMIGHIRVVVRMRVCIDSN